MLNDLCARCRQWIGVEDAPREFPAWLLSFAVHIIALVIISLVTYAVPLPFELTLSAPETPLETVPEEFHFDHEIEPEIGALSVSGADIALAASPEVADISEIVQAEIDPLDAGDVQFIDELELATTPLETSTRLVRGLAGVGVTGANGAIDRITHEILISIEDRDTMVVWLFDQSGSLVRQRKEIRERLERIYRELGLIREDIGNPTSNRQPLLTAVMAFGAKQHWLIKKPTADVQAIQTAVASVEPDESGIENVFTGIYQAAEEFRRWRSERNIMLIAVTDEVGDDYGVMLEKTVNICRRFAMPVYVLGVPAAFGQPETLLKWVDPDRKYDQTPRWGRVNQGPESLRPELLRLPFAGATHEPIDSGFGPFALTRLCYQTGGIYFAIHPNRNTRRRIHRKEIVPFSSHLAYFFDPQRMRPYRPDYVSIGEYERRVKSNPARTAVIRAAELTLSRMELPANRFVKQDESQFANELTEAQKVAAKLEPKLDALYEILKRGEAGREQEEKLRWQAAYDLAYGQTLAVRVRTRGYNQMLAKAKRGLKPEDPKSNTWHLAPASELSTSSRLEREAERAREYLERVVNDHDGTPWAMLARNELSVPMGWSWQESYTPLDRDQSPPAANNNNAPQAPRDDQKRMLPKGPPKRDVPRL